MYDPGRRKPDSSERLDAAGRGRPAGSLLPILIVAGCVLAMGVVEEVVTEPQGSAGADYDAAAAALDEALNRHMQSLLTQPTEDLLQHRYERFRYIDSLHYVLWGAWLANRIRQAEDAEEKTDD